MYPNLRIIPKLDIKGNSLVKGINLEGLRVLGKPEDFAEEYFISGADEMYLVDVVASLYGQNTLIELINRLAKKIFIPLTVGGGIKNIDDIRRSLYNGADKVSINSAAIKNPKLISEASNIFGSSTISISIETQKKENEYYAYTDSGRNFSGKKVIDWVREAEEAGAGEIIITSIKNEGLRQGMNEELIQRVIEVSNIPIVAAGGVGSKGDIISILEKKIPLSGVAIASCFHYHYLKKKSFSSHSEGNQDYIKGKRDQHDESSFSIIDLKKNIKEFNDKNI